MTIKLLLLLALLGATASSHAYNHKWLGAASDAWKNGQNWTNNFPNPTENRAMRLFFTYNDHNETTRQDIEGLVVDYLDVRGSYTIAGGAGQKLGFRNTNADPAQATIYCSQLLTFGDDLEVAINDRVNVWTIHQEPEVVTIRFNGRVSGPGELHLTGGGQVEFAGTSANTLTGPTYVRGGLLRLNKTGVLGIRGALIVGDDYGNPLDDEVVFLQSNQLATNSPLTVNRTGWLNLDGYSQTVSGLTMNGGRVSSGSGLLSLQGNVNVNAPANNNAVIDGRLAFGFAPRTFTVQNVYSNQALHVVARISGDSAATLIKNASGTLILSGSNTYNGLTLINQGTLVARGSRPLGSAVHGTVVNNGTTLHLESADLGDEPLTLSGQGVDQLGALIVVGSTGGEGPVTLADQATVRAFPGYTLTLNGVVSGPGGLDVAGRVALGGSSANTYTGPTRVTGNSVLELRKQIFIIGGGIGLPGVPGALEIDNGTVRLIHDNGISDASVVTLAGPASLLDVNGQQDTIGSLEGIGQVTLADGELTVGGNAQSTTTPAVISGAGGRLRKIGPATLTLTAANSYTGATTIDGGVLVVNGSQPGSAVLVKTNAVLAGSGIVGTISTQGGIVSPGVGPGRLNSKGVAFDSAATFRVNLNGPVAGTGYDQLSVSGVVHLGGSTLDATMGFIGAPNTQFTIIANDGADAVLGTFAGKPEGATFIVSGAAVRITYHGGDGNDVVLTQISPVPAPQVGSITTLDNGQVQISGTGAPGQDYTVEANSDLNSPNWVVIGIATGNASTGALSFTDVDAPNHPTRFYRFLVQ